MTKVGELHTMPKIWHANKKLAGMTWNLHTAAKATIRNVVKSH